MLNSLEHVQIPVRLMDRAIAWYTENLGFIPYQRRVMKIPKQIDSSLTVLVVSVHVALGK